MQPISICNYVIAFEQVTETLKIPELAVIGGQVRSETGEQRTGETSSSDASQEKVNTTLSLSYSFGRHIMSHVNSRHSVRHPTGDNIIMINSYVLQRRSYSVKHRI